MAIRKTPYGLIEAMCTLSTFFEVGLVSDWGDKAIIVEPGDDPFGVYRDWKKDNKS
jgi:hypothetical protein